MTSQITLEDRAGELQVRLYGDFGGTAVSEVRQAWQTAQGGLFWRHVMVDLSNLASVDASAKELLRDMYRRGVLFTAGNANALDLLHQISSRVNEPPVEVEQPQHVPSEVVRPRIHARQDRHRHSTLGHRAFSQVS